VAGRRSLLITRSNPQVEIVVEEAAARKLIPFCRRLGATGILTYDLLSEC
jgi:hypothetical protein